MNEFNAISEWLQGYPWAWQITALCLLALAAAAANLLTKRVLLRGLVRLLNALPIHNGAPPPEPRVIARLANVVPALVLMWGITAIIGLPDWLVAVVRNVCGAFIVLTLAMAISAALDLANEIYMRRPRSQTHPIKGYLQLVKIVVFAVAAILIIATLIDRSPLILLSGLGAMAAVLMLVFQDTLLSLVASVQISSNDMVRVGDWIEMPQLNADGFVMDIALHTIKVQNWDKTYTTLPTKRLISEPFKNWRGMQESGGRRIKRSVLIDQNSVRYLNEKERASLQRFLLLNDYLGEKERELSEWNARLTAPDEVNQRRMTNFGTFRAYVERYLRNHPGINQDMYVLVRQLAPGADGIPLELYCFTRSVAWADYEGVQADIFDHLLAILPAFGLRVFQRPSGADLRQLADESPAPAHRAAAAVAL